MRPEELRARLPLIFEVERELCRIGERPPVDEVVTYFVVLRAVSEWEPDRYLTDDLSLRVSQGRIVSGGQGGEALGGPPVCR